ncbi:hypothetical protein KDA_44650 [Dictyobacter alpinus]|uniref:Uncharacterized protein n=1 Tax=Dictyobacter alpinus TaxID=2014873 RepID=A0A402BC33_9CHLR|nr:hypothetical protein KDA_44650 [Dictyobacter alpinus]
MPRLHDVALRTWSGATRKAALLGLCGPTDQNDSQCCGAYTNLGL